MGGALGHVQFRRYIGDSAPSSRRSVSTTVNADSVVLTPPGRALSITVPHLSSEETILIVLYTQTSAFAGSSERVKYADSQGRT